MISGGKKVALCSVEGNDLVFHPEFFKTNLYNFFRIVGIAQFFDRESENRMAVEIHALVIFRCRHAVVG